MTDESFIKEDDINTYNKYGKKGKKVFSTR